ncbi:hypothetical protein LTR28_001887, partial [Elasticomyces elasticus]
MLGFEQANKYVIMDGQGSIIGYIAEQDHGIGSAVVRQLARTHRSFTTHIFDRDEKEVLRIHRPFAWINSRIRVYDPLPDNEADYAPAISTALQGTSVRQDGAAQISPLPLSEMRIIGEAHQEWAPLRRKYNLFTHRPLDSGPLAENTPQLASGQLPLSDSKAVAIAEDDKREIGMSQFAHISEPFLSWDFTLRAQDERVIGAVNRNFSGFAREIFTDTGVYALRMDSAALAAATATQDLPEEERVAMTLDQRAVMLATAVSIDFDYFSRHSGAGHGGFMPLWFPWWGGGAAEGGAAEAGAAGAAGAGEAGAAEGVGTAVGGVARGAGGVGATESAAAGAGTMAGYEAMQR